MTALDPLTSSRPDGGAPPSRRADGGDGLAPSSVADRPERFPSRAEVTAVLANINTMPSLARSVAHMALSIGLTLGTGLAALAFVPLTWWALPVWLAYALMNGTFAIGVWVIAHECGHRAFSRGTGLQDSIGFVLHSVLLVPYFSWQRSHAIHHARTNHLTEGETHVPKRADERAGQTALAARNRLGARSHGVLTITGRFLVGWPAYLLTGSTGSRGWTNHFWPSRPFSAKLFPGRWPNRVKVSSLGVIVTLALLVWWAVAAGSLFPVLALYVGPYLVCNAWLVAYTWLQHTDLDVPHYDDEQWSFVAGAFCSIDRPYGKVIDLLHHRIGSTHVAHHLDAKIPHYRADAATRALAEAFPDHYRFDPTPVPRALWRTATGCVAVQRQTDGWRFTPAGD